MENHAAPVGVDGDALIVRPQFAGREMVRFFRQGGASQEHEKKDAEAHGGGIVGRDGDLSGNGSF
ncbi:hypothetical protein Hsar01_02205 [Haloferula sargassicola]|uniref:Uncharacterized protein n=1 Tax=Haloferula sargassicola TaxID=490096 RepID=A0ABP9UNS2_9BACT